jgi:hypothetical protein
MRLVAERVGFYPVSIYPQFISMLLWLRFENCSKSFSKFTIADRAKQVRGYNHSALHVGREFNFCLLCSEIAKLSLEGLSRHGHSANLVSEQYGA